MPTVFFEGSDAPLDSWELAVFLRLFRVAYSQGLSIRASEEDIIRDPERYVAEFNSGIPEEEHAGYLANVFRTDFENEDLKIARIVKTSPLEISFMCVVSALTLAVIFSGGKVELKNLKDLKFTLPPLGVGINNLKEALRLDVREKQRRKK
jgi:hypothetical protein